MREDTVFCLIKCQYLGFPLIAVNYINDNKMQFIIGGSHGKVVELNVHMHCYYVILL